MGIKARGRPWSLADATTCMKSYTKHRLWQEAFQARDATRETRIHVKIVSITFYNLGYLCL